MKVLPQVVQFLLHRVVWVKHEAKGHITSCTMKVLPQVVQFLLNRVVRGKCQAGSDSIELGQQRLLSLVILIQVHYHLRQKTDKAITQ